jgi:signal transduction histidine kinase
MADRVAALGGVLDLTDAPHGGVKLTARIAGATR